MARDIIDAINSAILDYETSDDAMRWVPDMPEEEREQQGIRYPVDDQGSQPMGDIQRAATFGLRFGARGGGLMQGYSDQPWGNGVRFQIVSSIQHIWDFYNIDIPCAPDCPLCAYGRRNLDWSPSPIEVQRGLFQTVAYYDAARVIVHADEQPTAPEPQVGREWADTERMQSDGLVAPQRPVQTPLWAFEALDRWAPDHEQRRQSLMPPYREGGLLDQSRHSARMGL